MKIKIIGIAVAVVCIVVSGVVISAKFTEKSDDIKTGEISVGSIKVVVSSTGTIEAKKTVEVGTQVSGTVTNIYVDNNDFVKKDQVLAILDRKLLDISVKLAEADLLKAQSQYQLSLQDYNNNVGLNKENLISNVELEKLKVTKDAAYASKLSAESTLLKAKTNLDYSIIRSPIDGIVLERSIEEGQTISASTSAPTLFLIAEDLSNIEIEALVTESDIGQIKKGQNCDFTVEAYPEESFQGKVTSVLLQSTVTSNVVNYTVIVNAKNKNNLLLPGMTATIDFIISERDSVLIVPNSALTFVPSKEMMKSVKRPDRPMEGGEGGGGHFSVSDGKKKPFESENGTAFKERPQPDEAAMKKMMKTMGRLWIVSDNGDVRMVPVKKGLSDDQNTEVISDELQEGQKVIFGFNKSGTVKNSTKGNNQAGGHGGAGGPPPMMF